MYATLQYFILNIVIAVDCESYIHPSRIVITMEMSSDKVFNKAFQNNVEVQVSVNIAVTGPGILQHFYDTCCTIKPIAIK